MKNQSAKIITIIFFTLFLSMTVTAQTEDTLAPVLISGPEVENITSSSAVIVWETDELSIAVIEYGKGKNPTKSTDSDSLMLEHEVLLSNLDPETIYYFQLSITDSIGNGPFVTELDSFKTDEKEDDVEITYPMIQIEPTEPELVIGDTVVFRAVYWQSDSLAFDTSAVWTVTPDSLGTVDSNGVFVAVAPGECIVEATLDSLSDWISVKIFLEEDEPIGEEPNHLVVLPRDTVITLGMQIPFEVFNPGDSTLLGAKIDSLVDWSVQGMPVGTVDGDGIFTATGLGFALITAEYENRIGTAFVIVSDSTTDTTMNTITITRSSPSPSSYSVVKELREGENWIMSGLPHPLNILNGCRVYFPVGSLKEDIRIHIDLPGFAVNGPDGINFGPNGVVGGIDFQVMVNDTVKEPYYFESPLIVGVVYKRGLLTNLGIDPTTLSLYYANTENDSVVFDTSGIAYTTLALDQNRIFSSVAHFSTLAIKGETGTVVRTNDHAQVPALYRLNQNYPNPFNPTTTISFMIPEQTNVTVTIYDILGNRIRTMVDKPLEAGYHQYTWDSKDRSGKTVSAGIYFYQMQTRDFKTTRKMILVK